MARSITNIHKKKTMSSFSKRATISLRSSIPSSYHTISFLDRVSIAIQIPINKKRQD